MFRDSVGSDFWNDSGCSTINFENGSVMCSCNHLTHFAVLPSPEQPDNVRKLLLKSTKGYKIIIASEFSTSCVHHHFASCLIHFTGVPLGYYSHICTTKVSQSVHRLFLLYLF